MQQKWYQQTVPQVCDFFDVNPTRGLTKKDALNRLRRFGANTSESLMPSLAKSLRVTVRRDGKQEQITLLQLVLGDIVLLSPGQRVPADIRLIQVDNLKVNQNALTGETLPASKNTFALAGDMLPIQQKCMVFAGSFIESGQAVGVVVARGKDTVHSYDSVTKKKKYGIKGLVIARRLKRFGIIVLRKKPLRIFRKIDTVIIDYDCSELEILNIIRKVQLTRGIECKFIIHDIKRAQYLSEKLQASIYYADSKKGDFSQAQFIVGVDDIGTISIARWLHDKLHTFLWLYDGRVPSKINSLASIIFVLGNTSRDDAILSADLYSPKSDPLILERILYSRHRQ